MADGVMHDQGCTDADALKGLRPSSTLFLLCALLWVQMAAGLWPGEPTPSERPAGDSVVRALHGACKGSLPAVQRVYEMLLARWVC